uniref:Uncharacterized protein n=1 Tax=Octactis speculum TaxID=3111310 RepID=A0A7S2GKH6_9STRA
MRLLKMVPLKPDCDNTALRTSLSEQWEEYRRETIDSLMNHTCPQLESSRQLRLEHLFNLYFPEISMKAVLVDDTSGTYDPNFIPAFPSSSEDSVVVCENAHCEKTYWASDFRHCPYCGGSKE